MVHIGKEIKKKAKELRIGATELGERINVSKQNVYHIFERKSIDTEQLVVISKALNFDFFQLFRISSQAEDEKQTMKKTIQEQIKKIEDLERTNRILAIMVEEMQEKYEVRPKTDKKR